LYVSNAALKMDTKLDCEADVEGTVVMMVRGGRNAPGPLAINSTVAPNNQRSESSDTTQLCVGTPSAPTLPVLRVFGSIPSAFSEQFGDLSMLTHTASAAEPGRLLYQL
jgi:hypothetical protein